MISLNLNEYFDLSGFRLFQHVYIPSILQRIMPFFMAKRASYSLFPEKGEYMNLANTRGPQSCAADDLELIYNDSDSDFQAGYQFVSHQEYNNPAPAKQPNNYTNYYHQNLGLNQHTHLYKNSPHQQLTTINQYNNNYFNDFINDDNYNSSAISINNHDSNASSADIYGSSFESVNAPLDDEYDQNLISMKRKLNEKNDDQFWDPPDSNEFEDYQQQTKRSKSEETDRSIPSSTSSGSTAGPVTTTTTNSSYNIDLNEVNLIFDDYLLSNEASFTKLGKFEVFHNDSPLKTPTTFKFKQEESDSILKTMINPKSQIDTKKKEKVNIYKCSHCEASFKVKGYLTRHMKKHSSAKAFVCPFYKSPDSPESSPLVTSNPGTIGTKCHPTGGFSRRDTYKTHLKALHFIYPPGTKSTERNSVSGRCAGCFKFFINNHIWLDDHISKNECPGSVNKNKYE